MKLHMEVGLWLRACRNESVCVCVRDGISMRRTSMVLNWLIKRIIDEIVGKL